MNCNVCGTHNLDNALYCQRCGNLLNATGQNISTVPSEQNIPTVLSETQLSPYSQYQVPSTEKADVSSSPYTAHRSTPPSPSYSSHMANSYSPPPQSTTRTKSYKPIASGFIEDNKELLIILGIGLAVFFLIGCVVGGIYYYQTLQSTASKTLQAFCDTTRSGDYQAQYDLFTSSFQSQIGPKAQYTSRNQQINDSKGGFVNCSISNLVVSGPSASGIAMVTFGNKSTITHNIQLANENGVWKISNVIPPT